MSITSAVIVAVLSAMLALDGLDVVKTDVTAHTEQDLFKILRSQELLSQLQTNEDKGVNESIEAGAVLERERDSANDHPSPYKFCFLTGIDG